MKKIKQIIRDIEPSGKTFRITLEDIPVNIYRGLDFSEIRNEIKKANWLSESTNPLGDYPFLKRIDKELIII